MFEGVLIDETVKRGCQLTGHFERSSATGALQEAAGAFASKALHPFSQGGVGEMEEVRDGFAGLASDNLTDGLSAAKDAGFLGVLQKGSQGGQGLRRKVAAERTPRVAPGQ